MPRGKRSNSESSNLPEGVPAEGELKTKSGVATVKLVKPLQMSKIMPGDELKSDDVAEMSAEAESAVALAAPKKAPRPKVGRSSSARTKKSETGEEKSEKKERKPRKKKENITLSETAEKPAETTATAELKEASVPVTEALKTEPELQAVILSGDKVQPVTEEATAARLQIAEEPAGDLPADWTPEQHSRPQSFKSILFAVILFVLINLGFMTLFSASHKQKTNAPDVTKAAITLPPIPPANSSGLPALPTSGTEAKPAASLMPPAESTSTPLPGTTSTPAPEEKATAPSESQLGQPSEVRTLPPSLPAAPAEATAPAPMHSPITAESAPVTGVTESTLAPAAAATSAAAEPSAAVATPAATTIPAQPQENKADKAANSQELLSILDKN